MTTTKSKIGILIGLGITLLIAGLTLLKLSPLEGIEEKLYDYRLKIRGPIKPPDSITIASIDEKSIKRVGKWTWSRDKIAELIKRLNNAGAEIIVFDIIFSEPERNDPVLGRAMKEAGNVILPVVFDFNEEASSHSDEFLINTSFQSIENPEMFNKYSPIRAKTVLMPVYELIKEAMSLGHINTFPDRDGTHRWETLIMEYNGYLYPSITLRAAALYLGVPNEKVIIKATEGIQMGKRFIPTDRWGRALTNYYGDNYTFNHISISDILDGNVRHKELDGKIVLIGATAIGICDLMATTFSPAMIGVEKHANVIASILEERFLKKASPLIDLFILLGSGVIFVFLVTRLKAIWASFIMVIFIFVILLSGYYMLALKGLWVNIIYPSINLLLVFLSVTAYNYVVEERFSRRLRAMFSSYVAEKVVNELIKNPEREGR